MLQFTLIGFQIYTALSFPPSLYCIASMLQTGRLLFGRLVDRVTPRELLTDLATEQVDFGAMALDMSETPLVNDTPATSVVRTSAATERTAGQRDEFFEATWKERDELLRHREEMKKRFAQSLEVDSSYDGNTVRMGGRRPNYQGQDSANHTRVLQLATFIFSNIKMLPEGWHIYSKETNSISDRIMKCGVTVPYEFGDEFYFNNVLRKMFINKYRSLKANFTSVCRDLYWSKFGVCRIPIPIMSYNVVTLRYLQTTAPTGKHWGMTSGQGS